MDESLKKKVLGATPKHWHESIAKSFMPHWRRLRAEEKRLQAFPRYSPGSSKIVDGQAFHFVDKSSFLYSYEEIFIHKIFSMQLDNPEPFILDCGANIGLGTMYFKKHHPSAEIMAFEPDPKIFDCLQKNVKSRSLDKVQLRQEAVWTQTGRIHFKSDGADGGHINQEGGKDEVPCIRLLDQLDRPVDFLKIDIEGAETEVLKDCETGLKNVKYLMVEYHSYQNRPQDLSEILALLEKAGMRYYFHPEGSVSRHPFEHIERNEMGMDLQLNIYALRTK